MIYTITGATSFLGIALLERLISQGDKVMVVCRPGSHGLVNLPKGVEIVYAELHEYGRLDAKIAHTDRKSVV